MRQKLNQIKLQSNKSRNKGKLKYSDSDEEYSEKSFSVDEDNIDKKNIFYLFSFDQQNDYMERVKRLQGKIITKGLYDKMEDKLKTHEGKYYFSEDESDKDEKEKEKEEEKEEEKKVHLIEQKFTSKKAYEDSKSLFYLDSFVPPLIESQEEEKNKYEGLFKIILRKDR